MHGAVTGTQGAVLGVVEHLTFFLRLQNSWENASEAFSELTSPACGPVLVFDAFY